MNKKFDKLLKFFVQSYYSKDVGQNQRERTPALHILIKETIINIIHLLL
jgi:hypothetical protein